MESVEEILQSCRLCLVKEQVNIPIFEESSDLRKISEKINSCLPVKVAKDDNLPKKICDGCSYKLDMVYLFRNTSVDSEKQLIQWLTKAGLTNTIFNSEKDAKTSEILVKQESYDGNEVQNDLGADAHTYIMQQQKLPYQQDFAFPESSAANEEENGPLPKRPKRESAAKKKPPIVESEEEDDDDDDDFDNSMDVPKAEDNYSDEEEDRTDFDAPSTSADAQPGPSGVGTSEAPFPTAVKKEDELLKSKKRNLVCVICKKNFTSQKTLDKHNKFIHKRKLHSCTICGSKNVVNLKMHLQTHNVSSLNESLSNKLVCKQLHCNECDKVFESQSGLKKHILIKHKGLHFSCDICQKVFSGKRAVMSHRKLHSSNYVAPQYSCEMCTNSFLSKGGLHLHIKRDHEGVKYICDLCGINCSTKAHLTLHYRIHTGEKPFSCPACDKSFSRKDRLKEHQKIHDAVKPFLCNLCEKGFLSRKALRSHIEIYHEKKRRLCEICGKDLANAGSLNLHMKTHTGEKPFACEFCEKRFIKKFHLQNHIVVHTKERPFPCTLCEKRYTQASALKLHEKTVHSLDRPFSCDICGKNFVANSLLRMHRKSH